MTDDGALKILIVESEDYPAVYMVVSETPQGDLVLVSEHPHYATREGALAAIAEAKRRYLEDLGYPSATPSTGR
jgi:hypothetical protein